MRVFGASLGRVWDEWIEWEHQYQNANLETIRQYPITPVEDISDRALGSVSSAFYDAERDTIYSAFNYPGQVAHLGSISLQDGRIEKIQDIKGPVIYTVTSMAYDDEQKKNANYLLH